MMTVTIQQLQQQWQTGSHNGKDTDRFGDAHFGSSFDVINKLEPQSSYPLERLLRTFVMGDVHWYLEPGLDDADLAADENDSEDEKNPSVDVALREFVSILLYLRFCG